MKPLFLVGYMGCGKSTLGRKLARRLGIPYADTDALVEEREGASVSDVFRYEGEQRFREVEREVLDRVIGEGAVPVVSTGGGLPTWSDNMARMNAAGCTVYLRRSAEQIARRLSPARAERRGAGGLHGARYGSPGAFLCAGVADRRLRPAFRRGGGGVYFGPAERRALKVEGP